MAEIGGLSRPTRPQSVELVLEVFRQTLVLPEGWTPDSDDHPDVGYEVAVRVLGAPIELYDKPELFNPATGQPGTFDSHERFTDLMTAAADLGIFERVLVGGIPERRAPSPTTPSFKVINWRRTLRRLAVEECEDAIACLAIALLGKLSARGYFD